MINRSVRERILGSDEFKRMGSFAYRDIVEEICRLDSIGGLVRGIPHRFLCLVQKMEAISLKESVVADTLRTMVPEETGCMSGDQVVEPSAKRFKGNVYLIAALLLYLRLSGHFDEYKPLMKSFLVDFRKMSVVDEQNIRTTMYLDVFVDDLMNKGRVLSIHLGRECTGI